MGENTRVHLQSFGLEHVTRVRIGGNELKHLNLCCLLTTTHRTCKKVAPTCVRCASTSTNTGKLTDAIDYTGRT